MTIKNIGIIGSGIAGLGAAYFLEPEHNITIFEKNNYIGGHSRTINVNTPSGISPVDTGFIVFNFNNYPNLTALFSKLQVPIVKSNMSFGVSICNGWLEYGTQKLSNVFTQKSNLLKPHFWRMLFDIKKFNRLAVRYLSAYEDVSLEDCLNELKMGSWFRQYYLLAMGSAIWSTPIDKMLDFPASTFIRFFNNHGLLTINNQPQWYTIKGGSKEYINRLTNKLQAKIELNCPVVNATKINDKIILTLQNGDKKKFDEVVFACHADQALQIIHKPCPEIKNYLKSFSYQSNNIIVHSDTSFMPVRKNAWSSWVYMSPCPDTTTSNVSLSYWMNNLQQLNTQTPIFVTLNPYKRPSEKLIYDEYTFTHPVFDFNAVNNQKNIDAIQGKDNYWFAGSYQRYGFHEDGLLSAKKMSAKMGAVPK